MKLRRQIFLVIILMITIPLGAMAAFFLWRTGGSLPAQFLIRYVAAQKWVHDNVSLGPDGQIRCTPPFTVPPPDNLYLYDRAGRPILAGNQPPPWPDLSAAFQHVGQGGQAQGFVTEHLRLEDQDQDQGTVIFFLPQSTQRLVEEINLPYEWLTVYITAFSLSSLLVSLWIRRWNKSLAKLKLWTSQIGRGLTSTPLPLGNIGIQEFQELADTMEGLRRALRDESTRRGRFLASVSHDLKTPLTAISGYLEAIEDGFARDPATLQAYLGIIRQKTALLEERIVNLLEFAHLDSATWRLSLEEHDFAEFLRFFGSVIAADAQVLGVELHQDWSGLQPVRLRFDWVMVTRALENILSNAFRHGGPHGPVIFSAISHPDYLVVEIANQGPGIAADELEHIFEPYYRGQSAVGQGSGLGLFISQTVCQSHGWELTAASTPNQKTSLTIRISLSSVKNCTKM